MNFDDTPPWAQLAPAEFVARADAALERRLASGDTEMRPLLDLDDELESRVQARRAALRRSRTGAGAGPDLRPLCRQMLLALSQASQNAAPTFDALVLRCAARLALLSLIAGEPLEATIWSVAHRAWERVEAAGPDGAALARPHYTRMLLCATLVHTTATPRQLDKSFEWLAEASRELAVDRDFDASRHYFGVDLDSESGLVPGAVAHPGGRWRYFAHADLARSIVAARSEYFQRISVATLGLYEDNPLFEFHEALTQLERYWEYVGARHSGRDNGRVRLEACEVDAASGFAACANVVFEPDLAERWTLIDLSETGAGFRLDPAKPPPRMGSLAVFAAPERNAWILGTVARIASVEGAFAVGVRRLAQTWRPVVLLDEHAVEPSPEEMDTRLGFFVFGDDARGLADSILMRSGTFDPSRIFAIRPGKDVFKVRLSRVIQSGSDWERVGFDVQKR
ncbi:MAG: hypothetical protein JNM79_21445 [Burkholderiales bacterium]|nr:hypothetical protein [Burkholderiales bacterium]